MTNQLDKYRLGRKRAPFDPRNLHAAKYMKAVSPPPPAVDNLGKVPSWLMYDNDTISDCTIAAGGHLIGLWSYDASGQETLLSETDVLAAYSAVSGFDPNTHSNDNGAVELDVLNYWRKTGIGQHPIKAFVQLDVTDHDQLKQAINLFGGIYTGVNLPKSAGNQIGQVWQVDASPDGTPGSWGGHAVAVGKYDGNRLTCITWGKPQAMTWDFWDKYFEEAYAVVSMDFISTGKNPQGFDLATLEADLAAVGNKQPTPPPIAPKPSDIHCLDYFVPRAYQR